MWTESQRVNVDTTGAYQVHLGATQPSGLPLELFADGQARWIEAQIAGQRPQPRVLLTTVPYAAKAADAATLGGLPASAFVLAASISSDRALTSVGVAADTSGVTTTGGTVAKVPVFTGASSIGNSEIYDTGTSVGIGNVPNASARLDVQGAMIIRGNTIVSRTGNATPSAGFPSYAFDFYSNVYNTSTKTTANPAFAIQSEPVGNNTSSPSATLNVLYSATGQREETGFFINPTGIVHFSSGQTFPGAGSVSSVALNAPASDFTVSSSPVTTAGTLGLNWNVAPTSANVANAIVKRDGDGSVAISDLNADFVTLTGSMQVDQGMSVFASSTGSGVLSNNSGAGGRGMTSFGTTGIYVDGSDKAIDAIGNVAQDRTSGGWVKAMAYVNGDTAPYTIVRCFNSTLTGTAASTPPCGIDLEESQAAVFQLNFNFQVNDRFISATAGTGGATSAIAYATGTDQLTTATYSGSDLKSSYFTVFVF